MIPRFILSLAATPLPCAREDCIITGAAIAAVPAVFMNRRREKDWFEFIIRLH
jgi:hypothetical protein